VAAGDIIMVFLALLLSAWILIFSAESGCDCFPCTDALGLVLSVIYLSQLLGGAVRVLPWFFKAKCWIQNKFPH